MAKQWTKEEKIEILEKTKKLSLREAAKASQVHYTTIDRWRKDYNSYFVFLKHRVFFK